MADCNTTPLKIVPKHSSKISKSRQRWLEKVRNMGPMIAMVTFCCDLHFDKNILKNCDDYKHRENTTFPYPAGVPVRRATKQDNEIECEEDSLRIVGKEESAKSVPDQEIEAVVKVSKTKTRNSSRSVVPEENFSETKATTRSIAKKKAISPLSSSSNVGLRPRGKEARNKINIKNDVRLSSRKKRILETINNNCDLKLKRVCNANSKLKLGHAYGNKIEQQSTKVGRKTKVNNESKVVPSTVDENKLFSDSKKHAVEGVTDKKKAYSTYTLRNRVADDRNSVVTENEGKDKKSNNMSTFNESGDSEYELDIPDVEIKSDYSSADDDVKPKLDIKLNDSFDYKPFKCTHEDCKASFTQKINLKRHVRTHTGERPYNCPYPGCNATFTNAAYLLSHKRKHTGEKPFKCKWPGCKASFSQASNLFIHKRIHSDARPYKCDLLGCKAAFKQAAHLSKHKLTHSGVKPFKCDVCNASFTSSYNMRLHKRTHTGEKPYGCEFSGCRAAFADLSNLIVHKRIHTGDKPYICTYPGCSSAFAQSSGLTIHKRIHTNEKPYKCQFAGCRAMFAASSGLLRHTKKYNHGVS